MTDMLNGLETFRFGCDASVTVGSNAASFGYERSCVGGKNAGAV